MTPAYNNCRALVAFASLVPSLSPSESPISLTCLRLRSFLTAADIGDKDERLEIASDVAKIYLAAIETAGVENDAALVSRAGITSPDHPGVFFMHSDLLDERNDDEASVDAYIILRNPVACASAIDS